MTTEPTRTDDQKFVPGQHYDFDPPVQTNCIAIVGGQWEEKRFAEGWCLRYEPDRTAYAFQGKPVGEKGEYYFFVEWGKGSVAKNIPPPRLRVVK
jgi:hypothetical protein